MKKILLFFIAFSASFVFVSAQVLTGTKANKAINGSQMVRYTDKTLNPAYIKYRTDAQPDYSSINEWIKSTFNTAPESDIILTGTEKDKLGFVHYRYQQVYNAIPIHEAVFIVHVLNNKIVSFNGTIFSNINISNALIISQDVAMSSALSFVGASEYKWQNKNEEVWLKKITGNPLATYYPTAKKEIIYSPQNASFRYTYKIDIYASKPVSRQNVFVDAQNGKIIKSLETLHTTDVHGTAVTKYSGTRTITTDSVSPALFRLHETGRGNGIQTYNLQQQTDYSSAVDFTDTDNYWNNFNTLLDEAATDAQWGAEMTYDYYFNKHSRNSIDGNGFALISYVHYDQAYQNAFWDGVQMTYGDGNNNNPFCALDICGHEITHGLDSYTANLDYSEESGAMNEGFSDIFGTAIEFYAKPATANWTCGEDIGYIIRDLQNPNSQGDPDTYLGTLWDPNQEVHQNSTVLSHWFYLVCLGGSGTNDNGDAYNVSGIGMDKACAIAFRMLTIYLTNTSDYLDGRFYAIVSATDLFGGCSPEVETVTDAMYAVGLGNAYKPTVEVGFSANNTSVCSAPYTVYFTNQTINATNYTWYFGDGTSTNLQNPSHTYNTFGNFDVKLVASSVGCGSDSLTHTALVSIDSNNTNYANIPAHGIGEKLTCCTGTLFDSGETGNYSNNTNGIITIAPPGASSVLINFSSFDFEEGYDYLYIYDGPNTSSPLIGQFDGVNLPNGGIIQSTFGSITIQQTTDEGLVKTGFQLTWQCNMPSTAPVAHFYASEMKSCTGVIHFHDMSTNGPTSWSWNFGDGSTSNLQNPVHAYQSNGFFTVTLTATNSFGADLHSETNYIEIAGLPATPSVISGSGCDSGSVTLSANGTGLMDWYDASIGGNLLYTGNNFTTPPLMNTTTYYVEDRSVSPLFYTGKNDSTGSGGYFGSSGNIHYEIFNCYEPMLLKSVKVYAEYDGNRTILLRDSSKATLQSLTVFIPQGESRVNLNFDLPVQNKLQLVGYGVPDLFRNNNGSASYPYILSNYITITESSASLPPYNVNGNYYYFYDWEVQEKPCTSPRVPVVATIHDCSGIDNNENLSKFMLYPNPAENEFTIEFNNDKPEDYNIIIYDLIGKIIFNKRFVTLNGINKQHVNCSVFEKGVYVVQIQGASQNHYKKIVIQ